MTINLLSKTGGSLPKPAPDLSYPSSLLDNFGVVKVAGIDPSGALTTMLSLTGKFHISYLSLELVTAETVTVKLTVDGIVIWNDTWSNTNVNMMLIGAASALADDSGGLDNGFQCDTSFLLEMETTTDASVDLLYSVRPIL